MIGYGRLYSLAVENFYVMEKVSSRAQLYSNCCLDQLSWTNWPMLWIWMGKDSCLWRFTVIPILQNKLWFLFYFWFKRRDIKFQAYKKSLRYHTRTTLMQNCIRYHKWVCLPYYLWPGDSAKFIEHGRTWKPMDHHWHLDWSWSIGLPSYYETQALVE